MLLPALLWMGLIFLDYQVRVDWFAKALQHFHHSGLLVALFFFFALFLLFSGKLKKSGKLALQHITGWKILALWLTTALIFFAAVNLQGEYLAAPLKGLLYFTGHTMLLVLALLFFLISAAAYGLLLLRFLNIQLTSGSRSLIAIALGFALQGLFYFALAAFGLFQFLPLLLLLLLPLPFIGKELLPILKKTFFHSFESQSISWPALIALALLLLLTAANFTSMIRPMPIGFDASNLYLNIPHLLSEKGALLRGGQAYNWSLVMAGGFTIFGSTAMALLLSMLPGMLGIFVLIRLMRLLGAGYNASILASTVLYSLPVMMWQSTQEAKVDMAQLFYGLSTLLLFAEWISALRKKKFKKDKWWAFPPELLKYWILIGVISGFAIGIKYTALFTIIGMVVALAYQLKGQPYAWLGLYTSMAAVFGLGLYKLTTIGISLALAFQIAAILIFIGILLLIAALRRRKERFVFALKPLIVYGLFTFLTFLPWLGKNYLETGSHSLKVLISGESLFPSLEPAATDSESLLRPPLIRQYSFIREVNPHLLAQKEPGKPSSTTRSIRKKVNLESGVYEEIARYGGYESLFLRYLSIPYDITMQSNVPSFANGIGFLFLMLLPLLIFRIPRGRSDLLMETGKLAILLLWLGISMYAAYLNSHLDSPEKYLAGLYRSHSATAGLHQLHAALFGPLLTLGASFGFLEKIDNPRLAFLLIALLPLLAFYLLRKQISSERVSSIKWLAVFTVSAFMIWLLMGSGIAWYGIVILAAALGLIFFYLQEQTGIFSLPLLRNISSGAVLFWFFMVLMLRLTVFNPAGTFSAAAQPLDPDFSRYAAGEMTEEEVLESKIKDYLPVLEILNADSNLSYKILRFGTFMQYFIRENNERVIIDNQLNVFKFMYDEANGNASEVYQMMKAASIRFIIFSAHIGGYTEENLMMEKGKAFQDFVRQMYRMENRPIRLIYPQKIEKGMQAEYFAYELLFDKL